ncbi:MAG: (Fe-S)-binding protein [Planctomycetes bacterium]|nr:(Fe-S)-binding protein [Planctomycetota bacterium]
MASSCDPRDPAAAALARSLDCVHCGLCLPACPTHRVLGVEADSPRGRVYLMRALFEGRVEDPNAIRPFLDRCLDCRACETACPSGVRYGELLETTRAELRRTTRDRGAAPRIARFLLRHVVAHRSRLRAAFWLAALGERLGARWLLPKSIARLAPPVPPRREREPLPPGLHRPPPGVARRDVRVALFTGCVMEQMFGRVNRATLRLLLANGFDVVVPDPQRCCGALLVHAGEPEPARTLAEANVRAFGDADVVVVNSAGCGCTLREYGHLVGTDAAATFAAKCRDVSEFLAAVGLSATPAQRSVRVAYDDPCHLCHGQGVRQAPRDLLGQVPGLELVPHSAPEDCCGSAGIYNLLQTELAAAIGRRKAESLRDAGVDVVATGNPGCMLQIDSHLRAIGHPRPVLHTVELLLPPE